MLVATILLTFVQLNNTLFQCLPWENTNLAFCPKDYERAKSCPSPDLIEAGVVILSGGVLCARFSHQLLELNAQSVEIAPISWY